MKRGVLYRTGRHCEEPRDAAISAEIATAKGLAMTKSSMLYALRFTLIDCPDSRATLEV
jgi:hypothetical protein